MFIVAIAKTQYLDAAELSPRATISMFCDEATINHRGDY
jgi:hypothetical protein